MGFPMKNWVIRHGLYHPMFGLLGIQCFGSFFHENWLLVSQPRDPFFSFPSRCKPDDLRTKVASNRKLSNPLSTRGW